jgi:hypothetical protein
MFSVEQAICIVGDDPINEDALGWGVDAAWVIDGATPLGEPYTVGPLTSAAWYAGRVSTIFSQMSVEATGLDAVERVQRAQARLADELRRAGLADTRYPPSASAALLLANDDAVSIAVIGDV